MSPTAPPTRENTMTSFPANKKLDYIDRKRCMIDVLLQSPFETRGVSETRQFDNCQLAYQAMWTETATASSSAKTTCAIQWIS